LEKTNKKFRRRFEYIEEQADIAGRELGKMTLDEMDTWWNEAKKLENKGQ